MTLQPTPNVSSEFASAEDIATCLNATFESHRWHLPYANSTGGSATVLKFSVCEDGIAVWVGEHHEADLRSMSSAVVHALQEVGFCTQETQSQKSLDVTTGSLWIPARSFDVQRVQEVKEAIGFRDSINQFCKEFGIKTTWRVSEDFAGGIHLQASVGQAFLERAPGGQQDLDRVPQDLLADCGASKASFHRYTDRGLIKRVVNYFCASGILAKNTDIKLSQHHPDVFQEMEENEIHVALRLPLTKVAGLSKALGQVERSTLSKPVYEMTARAVPFIEDFVRAQIQLRAARDSSFDGEVAPAQGHGVSQRQKGDMFEVRVQPMTPCIPSVHVEVHCKREEELLKIREALRAHRLHVKSAERAEPGYAGAVRILHCEDSRFKEFLEGHIRASLNRAWSSISER